MKHFGFLLTIFLTISLKVMSQNTVGTLINTPNSFNGYTLFSPINGFSTYLIDNCGRLVHNWNSIYPPGLASYLQEDGSLIRAGRVLNSNMSMGGLGGVLEKIDWDGTLRWRYNCSGPDSTAHHDFKVLPNGNILMLVAYAKPIAEAIGMGRDSSINTNDRLYTESVIELEFFGLNLSSARVVWRWDVWDHLIQDRDSSKPNYAVISEHPERMNINYIGSSTSIDWLHSNSIDYNESLDQIVIGFRNTSEFWVIDHSTTIAESASSTGGRYGKGGDILYRWGNPAAYNRGSIADQKLFGQHDVNWIPEGYPGAGNFILFNNGDLTSIAAAEEIAAPVDAAGFYAQPSAAMAFGPDSVSWSYRDPSNPIFNSRRLSSAERLENGNTLICSGNDGYFVEVDNQGNPVWAYRNPATGSGILTQGNPVNPGVNSVFSARRYGPFFPAFAGRSLEPGEPIELNYNLDNCQIYPSAVFQDQSDKISIYPNPVRESLTIASDFEIKNIKIYNSLGEIIMTINNPNTNITEINLHEIESGFYILNIESEHISNRVFLKL
jgi:hypothetical protein